LGMEPPVLMEPPAGRVGDVRRPVVEHRVHRKFSGDTRVELVKEGDEVRGGVAVHAGGLKDPAAVHVQRSQQGRGAMTDVLVLLAGPGGRGQPASSAGCGRGHRSRSSHPPTAPAPLNARCLEGETHFAAVDEGERVLFGNPVEVSVPVAARPALVVEEAHHMEFTT
jgi:hypothetical protein